MLDLHSINGEEIKSWVDQLLELDDGCVSYCYAESAGIRFYVCMGWHKAFDERWDIAWKIGLQPVNAIMQSDFDVDFGVPKNNDSGEVDDTTELVQFRLTPRNKILPKGYQSWDALASHIRAEARRVYRLWK